MAKKNKASSNSKKSKKKSPAQAAPTKAEETMSKCAALCQEQRWREAAKLCRTVVRDSRADGNEEIAVSLEGALQKIEFSLRRQMAAALVGEAQNLLKKEYLLDVGK